MGFADLLWNYWAAGGVNIDERLEAASGGGIVYADKHLVVRRTEEPDGLYFAGEIDVTNSHAVAESLGNASMGDADIHLDLSGLSFCDISGIRSLVDAAESRQTGRLMLHGLPALLQTVMHVTGWSDLPNLHICNCKVGQ
jgi:anti-anti-sigma factor